MKKRSSLNTRICEFFPPLISRMTTPVQRPCDGKTDIIQFIMHQQKQQNIDKYKKRTDDDKGSYGLIHPSIFLE